VNAFSRLIFWEQVFTKSLDFFPETVEISRRILVLPTSRLRDLFYTIYLLNFLFNNSLNSVYLLGNCSPGQTPKFPATFFQQTYILNGVAENTHVK
jgi:hypothetical protein